jgi:lipoprotein Spr
MYKAGLAILSISIVLFISCGSSKNASTSIPVYDSIQVKYAKILEIEPAQLTNLRLYRFINVWLGTPYKYGGTTKSGIDCSALVERLFSEVYKVDIPGTAIEQYKAKNIYKYTSKNSFGEGDLIFFTEPGKDSVTHVGLYLQNNWFVNAEKTKGVKISKLDTPYWQQRLYKGGKVKLN